MVPFYFSLFYILAVGIFEFEIRVRDGHICILWSLWIKAEICAFCFQREERHAQVSREEERGELRQNI